MDVLAVLQSDIDALEQRVLAGEFTLSHGYDKVNRLRGLRAEMAELIADANRWRAVTAVYAGFQTRGDKMIAYISTPQWLGDWADFNDAIDRHFEINGAALENVGSAS